MERELNLKLFEDIEKKFVQHLNIEGNERIIFSGKFGHGKTTFLSEFFKVEKQKEHFWKKKYNVISLFPVNYSIASNEDIFRYIKYDIILEMLKNGYQIENSIESYLKTLPEFLKNNFDKVFAAIVYMIPNVGKDIIESYEKWNSLKEEYLKYHDSKLLTTGDEFANFIDKLEMSEGSLYEDDLISKLIQSVLQEKLKKDDVEENVLVIDDLDRIDPEHIFRILNVFAAHFDRNIRSTSQTPNKFGFDKIILVCDIENIRSIFKAKYGIETDFNGYINKFYSYEIFYFNHRKELENFTRKQLSKMVWYDGGGEMNARYKSIYYGKLFNHSRFFFDILYELIENRELDLRNIIKLENMPITYNGNTVFQNSFTTTSIAEDEFPILFHLRLLSLLKGGPESLKASIGNIKKGYLAESETYDYARDLIYLNTILFHKGKNAKTSCHMHFVLNDQRVEFSHSKENDTDEYKYKIERFTSFGLQDICWLINSNIDLLKAQNIV